MAVALAASSAIPMRIVALVATVMMSAVAPRASLAQLRTVVDEQPMPASVPLPASAASAMAEWEAALADRVTDADTWSGIGQRLTSAGRYRESIAAFERSLVLRGGSSLDDARGIAESYAKLGNVKQASRWRAAASGVAVPQRRHSGTTV